MSEQLHTPVTPYIEDGWLCEPCEPDYAPGVSQPTPGSWSKPIVNLTELDGYAELITAAEQRGAEKALADFKRFVIRVLPKGLVNRASIIADLDESMKRLDETGHLLMGPLHRADQIEQEGDDVEDRI